MLDNAVPFASERASCAQILSESHFILPNQHNIYCFLSLKSCQIFLNVSLFGGSPPGWISHSKIRKVQYSLSTVPSGFWKVQLSFSSFNILFSPSSKEHRLCDYLWGQGHPLIFLRRIRIRLGPSFRLTFSSWHSNRCCIHLHVIFSQWFLNIF